MEKLLNKLIKKGWRPRGINVKKILNLGEGKIVFIANGKENFSKLRFITVKESGLRQFVCENELYPQYIQHRWFRDLPTNGLQPHDYRYWVIESALREELELERFLLDNIKIS